MRFAFIERATGKFLRVEDLSRVENTAATEALVTDPPSNVGQGWVYRDGGWIDPAVPIPVVDPTAAVDIERDRRLALGVAFAGHTYQTRGFDIANMTGAATAAVAAMMQGAQAGDLRWASATSDFAWIDVANVAVPMDAPSLIGLAQAAMNRRAALIFAARAIKDRFAAGAALNLGDDALWPT